MSTLSKFGEETTLAGNIEASKLARQLFQFKRVTSRMQGRRTAQQIEPRLHYSSLSPCTSTYVCTVCGRTGVSLVAALGVSIPAGPLSR